MTDKVGEFDSLAPYITAGFLRDKLKLCQVFCWQLCYVTNRSSQELITYLFRKPLRCACARLSDLFGAVTRWCVRFERAEKGTGDCCYLVNRGKECSFVGFRWLVEAAHLSDEL